MPRIAIMGGGIAGCTTAVELSRRGYEIVILEKNEDILLGTSARTPGLMGLGYHYFDYETAKFYMKNTIGFMKQYSDCFLGDEETSYLRDGRYFITPNSLVPTQELMASFDKVSRHFETMCRSDSSNDVFETYHLHRTMEGREFQDDVNLENVVFAIETKELLLDWQKFKARLTGEITASEVLIRNNFEVNSVETTSNGRFILSNESGEREETDYVINCTWQNIEKLNKKLGIGDAHFKKDDPKKSITCRLKLLAEVELPESLKRKHSMFFCVGPHAMFSNIGDGIGRITFAPITNFGTTTESEMPEQFERWLTHGLSEEEEADYGQRIIDGVADYIPEMQYAKLRRVIPGIVKSEGSVDLADRNSPFHKRSDCGVEEQQIGWVDNAAMKLFYSLHNKEVVAAIIEEQEKASLEIGKMALGITQNLEIVTPPTLCQFFESHLRRNFKAEDISQNSKEVFYDLNRSATLKQRVLTDISPVSITNLKSNTELLSKLTGMSK